MITLIVYAGGGIGTTYQILYVWVAMYAFFYFGRVGSLVQLALVVVASANAYFGPVHAAARVPAPTANLLVLLGTVASAAVVATWMVDQLREQGRLRAELAVAQERTQEADRENEMKSRVLGAISHEMKTPLNSILGFAELLPASSLSPRQKRYVDNISAAGKQLLALITDLLDLAKTAAGRLQVAAEPVELAPLLSECVAGLRPQLNTSRLSLSLSCPERLVAIADRRRLVQVILNLLSNAIKFTSSGGQISVAASHLDPGRVEIAVGDTGVGIPADQFAQVFEEFVQLDAGRRAGGSGLGLAISRGLVRAMRGEIVVDSSLGKGSVFRVRLPALAEDKLAQVPSSSVAGTRSGVGPAGSSLQPEQQSGRHRPEPKRPTVPKRPVAPVQRPSAPVTSGEDPS